MKKILIGLIALLALGVSSTAQADVFFGVRGGGERLKMKNASQGISEGKSDFVIGGFVGYHYSFFRLEAEYMYHPERNYENKTIQSEIHTAMGNLYFSPPIRSVFHPYMMTGFGAAFHETTVGSDSKKNSSFAWQLGAGLELEFTQRVFLDVGARLFSYGKGEMDDEKYKVKGFNYYTGLRFEY